MRLDEHELIPLAASANHHPYIVTTFWLNL
jgi:hypothetical protein